MKRQKFYKDLQHLLQQLLGNSYTITFCDFQKVGLERQGAFIIKEQEKNIASTIYLKEYYMKFLDGENMKLLAKEIAESYISSTKQETTLISDLTFLSQKNEVEKKLFFRCINTEKNQEFLMNAPHKEYLDLSLIYYILVKKESTFLTSIAVTNQLMHYYGWTEESLFQISMENSRYLFPEQILSMSDTILNMMLSCEHPIYNFTLMNEIKTMEETGIGLMVISNSSHLNGFSSIFYPNVLAQLAEQKGANLIIIPSSIHEAIAFPDYGNIKTETLHHMIIQVNDTQVLEEEQLSEEAYYYDKDSKLLFFMKDYKEGKRTLFVKI